MKFFRSQEGYIRKKISRRWSTNPQLLDLLTGWTSYLIEPSAEHAEEFARVLQRLANQGILFDLFCFALEKAGYSTLVIACDELDMAAMASLKTLWDPPSSAGNPFFNNLNIILVLFAKESILQQVQHDEALKRRFCRTKDAHYRLSGPVVGAIDAVDDFDHVAKTVRTMIYSAPQLKKKETDLSVLRAQLANRSDLTWHILWETVIRASVEL